MFTTGYGTVILYLVSLSFFLLAVLNPVFFYSGIILGALFFIVSSIVIGSMMKKRFNS